MSHIIHSDQYNLPCVVPGVLDKAEAIINRCREVGAVRNVDGEEFVVELRAAVGPELYTAEAIQRSIGR